VRPGAVKPDGDPPMATVSFRTLGCKLNQCETAQMEEALLERGYRLVSWTEPASIRVLNTCTVTAKTDRECRREIRRALRLDPGCRMVVTGCYAQVAPEQSAAIPGVTLVLGNLDKLHLGDHLERLLAGAPASQDATGAEPAATRVTPYQAAPVFHGDFFRHFSGYTRAFLKVQNGCDNACSYCVIPAARGHSRSMLLADVATQVRLLADQGFREVVLTGIHLGAWGRDTGEGSLADLLAALTGFDESLRFRLSSTEPMEVDDRVLRVMEAGGERFAHHLHVPLQSGSDAVLRRMNRPYRGEAYLQRVEAIRGVFPDAAIGADVIVGFPGETDQEFAETLALVERAPLTYLHVFTYSDRPGTRASAMMDKVPPEVIAARGGQVRRLGARKDREFQDRFQGTVLTALVLKDRATDGRLVGLTGNYLEVLVEGGDELKNSFVPVRALRRGDDGRWDGELA
jgi:threonylcarbamoyladenosine tRNA methylthiotransferase MtaB